MIKTAGSVITVETPPSADGSPLQGAVVSDIVARPGGGFMICYKVDVYSLIGNSSTNLYLATYGAGDIAASGRQTVETSLLSGQGYTGRFAETGSDTAVLFVQGINGMTLREFDGRTGTMLDGPDAAVDGDTDSQTFIADAATLVGGGSFLLYQDDDAGDSVVRGRLFGTDNQPLAGHFDVAKLAGKDIGYARADQLSGGDIAVTFTITDDSGAADIYARLLTPSGDADTEIFRVNQKTAGFQYGSQIAALEGGGFLVAWVDWDQNGSAGVKGRTFDAEGNATSAEFIVDPPSKDDQDSVAVAALSGGRCAVLWYEDIGGGKIWAQLFDREGGRIGDETLITRGGPPSYYEGTPRVVEVDNGIMVVAWTRDVRQEGILARRFDVGQAGTDGNDILDAKLLGRFLDGFDGRDTLTGGKTADELDGGAGRDTSTGKQGNDHFVFTKIGDSLAGAAERDIITDFGTGKDRIDLSAIDAISGGDDDAFSFIRKAEFEDDPGTLRYQTSGKSTLIQADTDGDGEADFEIELDGRHALSARDFIL